MDWIGILIFILIAVFKALGESEQQKRKRAARQGRTTPPVTPPTQEPVPKEEVFPPVIQFPFFEEEREPVWVEEPAEEPIIIEDPPPARPVYQSYLTEEPKVTLEVPQREINRQVRKGASPSGPLPGLQLTQAMEGIIWSEILQPPRAMRPLGTGFYRGRRY